MLLRGIAKRRRFAHVSSYRFQVELHPVIEFIYALLMHYFIRLRDRLEAIRESQGGRIDRPTGKRFWCKAEKPMSGTHWYSL